MSDEYEKSVKAFEDAMAGKVICSKCNKVCTPHDLYTHVCEPPNMKESDEAATRAIDAAMATSYGGQPTQVQHLIQVECDLIANFLVAKNRKYGNSALNPVRIFSRATAEEAMLVRMDDKLSRIHNQQADDQEDAILDLIGYLILHRVWKKLEKTDDR